MLVLQKHLNKFYYILFGLVFVLLAIPWAIYEQQAIDYTFLPRKIIFVLMAVISFIILLTQRISLKQMLLCAAFFGLGLLHTKIAGYLEPHYFFEFIYLEIALLLAFAPTVVKQNMLKFSSWLLYVVLAKAFVFRMGSYVHGGFYSSNLFATYIVFLSFIEVYRRRFWNLIPAILVIYFVGSKSSYMAMTGLVLFSIYLYLEAKGKCQSLVEKVKSIKLTKKFNFYWPMFIAAIAILIFTQIMVQTAYFKDWTASMAPSKEETTKNNLIMYGVDVKEQDEAQREVLLITKEMQYHENKISISAPPLITDVGLSLALRLTQYEYMYKNILSYFWTGDTVKSQGEMFGHNPHSAFPDFVSRLGLLYLILVLVFYARLFKVMDLVICNVCIIPILAFQPYGFTIGHSIVILSMVYSLAKVAKEQKPTAI